MALFPHRFDYIYASHSQPGETPNWRTENRHPLSDRLIQQGGYLYGVRFGSQTRYCLLDIDSSSAYHPKQDPLAISRIVAALESLGLVAYIACTSSYSGGIHLYFPFTQTQSSWQLAIVLATLLENAGFKLKPGQLEVFPNPKPYRSDGNFSLFNAHRLPMQIGSYLLNRDFQPVWSDRDRFMHQWHLIEQQNQIENRTLKRIIRQEKRQLFRISGKADKFIHDLNTEIELGWTGAGQTNRLLGRITMRCYVFHHLLFGGEPLSGQALVNEIVRIARSLPGYTEWCRHQHEIENRAEEWARCIENSHYFHYGDAQGKFKPIAQASNQTTESLETLPTWNQQQSLTTREKIRKAIADLLDKNLLPVTATARFKQLLTYGIGGGSLYRHKDLWHPEFLLCEEPQLEHLDRLLNTSVDQSSNTPGLNTLDLDLNTLDGEFLSTEQSLFMSDLALPDREVSSAANPSNYSPSLLSTVGGNSLIGELCSDRTPQVLPSTGGNPFSSQAFASFQSSTSESCVSESSIPKPSGAESSSTVFQASTQGNITDISSRQISNQMHPMGHSSSD